MRHSTTNITRETPPTEGHKAVAKIDLEPVKMKNYGGRFVYQPSQISPDAVRYAQPKSTDEYLQGYHPGLMFQKPEYEKEELVFDKAANKWKLMKEEDIYKYQF
jgi:hypothetical protein